jgi:hypothetical protein
VAALVGQNAPQAGTAARTTEFADMILADLPPLGISARISVNEA